MEDTATATTGTEAPALGVDLSCYLPLLEDDAISDADKQALLESLWSIIVSFVQLGWGVHPIQHMRDAENVRKITCGKPEKDADAPRIAAASMVKSEHQSLIETFRNAASALPQEASDS